MTRKRSRVHPRVKTKYRVPTWTEYDRTLVRRGDITVWLHEEALAGWSAPPARTRGPPGSWPWPAQAPLGRPPRSSLRGRRSSR